MMLRTKYGVAQSDTMLQDCRATFLKVESMVWLDYFFFHIHMNRQVNQSGKCTR